MLRLVIKIVALYLLYILVIKPAFLGVAGRTAATVASVQNTFWWMSPAANGW